MRTINGGVLGAQSQKRHARVQGDYAAPGPAGVSAMFSQTTSSHCPCQQNAFERLFPTFPFLIMHVVVGGGLNILKGGHLCMLLRLQAPGRVGKIQLHHIACRGLGGWVGGPSFPAPSSLFGACAVTGKVIKRAAMWRGKKEVTYRIMHGSSAAAILPGFFFQIYINIYTVEDGCLDPFSAATPLLRKARQCQ